MVLHTVNPRLFAEQIRYIIDYGGARILCVDPDLLSIVEPLMPELTGIAHVIVLCDAATMPAGDARYISYEDMIEQSDPVVDWPVLDENSASSPGYTSGTTGNPKGVLYSHRSKLLHAFAAYAADSMALSARDSILLVTPLFHVNAWGSAVRCSNVRHQTRVAEVTAGRRLFIPAPERRARPFRWMFRRSGSRCSTMWPGSRERMPAPRCL